MEIIQHHHGAVTVLKPIGPLGDGDADEVKRRMLDVGARSLGRLVIDASEVPYVDSRGLEALVETADELARGGQTLKLCGTSDLLREVFELTGLGPLFEQYPDVNAAVRSFL